MTPRRRADFGSEALSVATCVATCVCGHTETLTADDYAERWSMLVGPLTEGAGLLEFHSQACFANWSREKFTEVQS